MDVPFFRPDIGSNEIDKVVQTLKSGWLTTGPNTRQFEVDFAAYIGGGVTAIAVNSATAALHLGLEALGVGPGDEVIVPTLTFTATAEVVRYLGADPVFVDVDPITLNISLVDIERAITEKTRAIIPVHFGGLACDVAELNNLAKRHGIRIMDDAAHALPTDTKQGRIGNTGFDVTAFSFYANKTITTGEGGMLVSLNPDIIERAKTMRLHGINRDVFNRFTDLKASWQYDVVAPGYKYNMTDMAGALGVVQLTKADAYRLARCRLAETYSSALTDLPVKLPHSPTDPTSHCWHLYVLRLTDESPIDRNTLISKLREAGIGCSVHYMPLHQMTYWQDRYHLEQQHYPVANKIFETCLSLPLFPTMSTIEQTYVIEKLHELLGA